MKIDKLYLKDVLDKYEEVTGEKVIYDDDKGMYFLFGINSIIKKWNNKLEINGNLLDNQYENLIKLTYEMRYYNWIKFEEKENEKQNDEN